jgi:hypothetical protein
MCKQCEIKPVYEFTNKRKVCGNCFIKWFQKKVLYTIRKFKMIKNGGNVYYENKGYFKDAVLEDILKMISSRGNVDIIKIKGKNSAHLSKPNLALRGIDNKLLIKQQKASDYLLTISKFSRALKRGKIKDNFKIALSSTTDAESYGIVNEIIEGKGNLKNFSPVDGEIIKPLYLFLDKEVLLYAKLKKLKFKKFNENTKKDKISEFVDELEKKHPEVKQAVIGSCLKLN